AMRLYWASDYLIIQTTHLFGKMKKHIFILIGLFITVQLNAQQFEFTKAKKLGDVINSESEEINPRVSEDGSTLYFTRTFSKKNLGGKYAGQDIWYSERSGSEWGSAKNLKALNNGDNNAVVGLNEEASKLYLINNYTAHPRRVQGLVTSNKDAKDKWSKVTELPVQVEVLNDHYGFYLTPDEEVLVISMMAENSEGEEDLFVSFNNRGNWTQPKHMGSVVNSEGFEISPFLSADKQTLFFASNGFGGEGGSDIFSTTRLDDSWTNWSEPENLGSNINSSSFDAYFVISNSGKVYFASNRGLTGMSDIYSSEGKKVEKQKEEDVVVDEEEEEEEEEKPEEDVEEPKEPEILPIPSNQIVYFPFESAELTDAAQNELREVIKIMASRQDVTVELKGHTDRRGTESYNDDLSARRAKAVMDFLTKNQISGSKIKMLYFGEKQLVSSGSTSQEHQKNRRVEIEYKRTN
ncbi:MAG: OmpA family protein, partial [Bacteroidota bacterium]